MPGEQLPIIANFEGGQKRYFMTWHKLFLLHTIRVNIRVNLINKFYTFSTFLSTQNPRKQ